MYTSAQCACCRVHMQARGQHQALSLLLSSLSSETGFLNSLKDVQVSAPAGSTGTTPTAGFYIGVWDICAS